MSRNMIGHRVARIKISLARKLEQVNISLSLLLAISLALLAASVVVAQSQLPGKPLTTDPATDLRPAWSPDGLQIAFFSSRSGNYDIWVMDADGGNQRQRTDDPADDRRPAWSPDGKYLAFDSDRAGSRDIWVMDADGGNQRPLTSGPAQDSFPAWSPDGSQVAFYSLEDGVLDIWVVGVQDFLQGGEAGQPERVTSNLADAQQNQCTFACHVPAWSPDSRQIAYQVDHSQIWVVGADGNDSHPLTDGKQYDHFPWWTQDGRILYLYEHRTYQAEPVNDVWVMDADGSNATLLFPDIPHGGPFYWSPDGSGLIAFHSPRAGNFDIYTITLGQEASTPQPFVAARCGYRRSSGVGAEPAAAPPRRPPRRLFQGDWPARPGARCAVAVIVVGGVLAASIWPEDDEGCRSIRWRYRETICAALFILLSWLFLIGAGAAQTTGADGWPPQTALFNDGLFLARAVPFLIALAIGVGIVQARAAAREGGDAIIGEQVRRHDTGTVLAHWVNLVGIFL
jgi:Tol biopolymer transport system component